MKTALFCRGVLISAAALLMIKSMASGEETTAAGSETEAPKITEEQMDSLVAPIALYPDPLLAQTLAASTYPIEIMQASQWLEKNKDLKDQALADAVAKQPWDPSVQAMAAFPEVTQRMAGNIQWTSDMGNAFLAQQSDVMAAVQRMRAKAESKGALKTSEEQKVETQTVGGEQVIVVEQADPKTVYVPSYDPVVVYGEPAVPYPTYTYPGYIAGSALAFGGALALGAAWGNNWGWGCGWNQGEIDVNVNNTYVNNYNKKNNIQAGQAGKWQHSPEHRGNAPYGDRGTASKYGGRAASGAGGPGEQVALVGLENQAAQEVSASLAVLAELESPVVPEARVELESPVVPEAPVESASPAVQADLASPVARADPANLVPPQETPRKWCGRSEKNRRK